MLPSSAARVTDRPKNPPLLPLSKPPEVNRLDHQIGLRNGSTSVLEFSPQRVQRAKVAPRPSLSARVEELTRELGQMRHEIQFYRQCFEILQRLRDDLYNVHQQLFREHSLNPGSSHLGQLIARLHRAVEESVRREAGAKRIWIGFWGRDINEGDEGGWI
jgi:hypothetical protein